MIDRDTITRPEEAGDISPKVSTGEFTEVKRWAEALTAREPEPPAKGSGFLFICRLGTGRGDKKGY